MRIRSAGFIALLTMLVAATAFARGAAFTGTDLRDARFTDCDLQMAQFTNCNLSSAQFINLRQSTRLLLKGSHLDNAVFENLRLTNARWSRVGVDGLDASYLKARNWKIRQSDLTKLTFERSYLRYATLDHADLQNFSSQWSRIPAGRWKNTDLRRGDFQDCDFSSSSFYRGSMKDAGFRNVDFSNVRLQNCKIRGLVINGVRIDDLID